MDDMHFECSADVFVLAWLTFMGIFHAEASLKMQFVCACVCVNLLQFKMINILID